MRGALQDMRRLAWTQHENGLQENHVSSTRAHATRGLRDVPAPRASGSKLVPFLLWFGTLAWVARVTVFQRGRSTASFSEVDTAALAQVVITGFLGLVVLFSGRLARVWSAMSGSSTRLLLLYFAVCVLSAVWSILPEYSLYRGVEAMVMILAAFVALAYAPDFRKAERMALIISWLVIAMSIYVNFKTKEFGLTVRFFHTNSYTATAAMVFMYCFGEYFIAGRDRRRLLFRNGLAAAGVVALGTSGGTLLATMASILFLAILYRNTLLVTLGLGLGVVILAIAVFGEIDVTVLFPYLFPDKRESEVMDLGGRLRMWAAFWEYFLDSPVTGHGFGVISTERGRLFASDPHNSIIAVIVGTGTLGLLPVLVYGFRLLREMLVTSTRRIPGAMGCSGALTAGLANGMTMPVILSEWEESGLVFAAFSGLFLLFVWAPYRRDLRAGMASAATFARKF